ncbi:MAG: GNAT family N-acetyltransferase [Bacteroidales bacterium]
MSIKSSYFNYKENLFEQRELFKDCFPETNGQAIQKEEHYFWKFHSFPYEKKSWEYVSYLENEMVAYYAAIPYVYKIGNTVTPVAMVCDVMTSSKHRGKGIFTKIGSYATNEMAKDLPFTMGYPIRKEVLPGHIKVGWKVSHELPLYIKFIKFNSLFSSKKIGFLSPLGNLMISVYNNILKGRINKNYSFEISDNVDSINGFEAFSEQWRNSVQNALVKDIAFQRWRYSAPERYYKFISIRDNGKLIGYLSLRKIIKENVPSYGVLDYMVLPGYEDCHSLINRILVDMAKNDNVESILIMMSRTSSKKYLLKRFGFFKSPFLLKLIIKNLNNQFKDEELFNEKNWHLMWVDSDDL